MFVCVYFMGVFEKSGFIAFVIGFISEANAMSVSKICVCML